MFVTITPIPTLSGFITMIGSVHTKNIIGKVKNSETHLDISTYDGSGQLVHPSVIYSERGWNGFHYLMAETPYKNSNHNYENASMRYSNDGISWTTIPGQPDPVVPLRKGTHGSDPNIVLVNDTLYLFYRVTTKCSLVDLAINYVTGRKVKDYIYYITSIDGVNWSSPVLIDLCLTLPRMLSPSFYFDGELWHCWAHSFYDSYKIEHFASINIVNWARSGTVSMNMDDYVPWHSEVKFIDGIYMMLLTANNMLLFFYSNDGLSWTMGPENPILEPKPGSWDESVIYKSSLVKVSDTYKIWYSAYNKESNSWYIGYTTYPTNLS